MIIEKKQSKKIKIIFNIVSAVLIVLFWFIFYYIFQNHCWQCSSKQECLIIHKDISWESLNVYAFFVIYFLIQLVNYLFTDLPLLHYAFIQAMLDFAIFCASIEFMERTSWFVPITGVYINPEIIEYKVLLQYFYVYGSAMVFSNIIMSIIHGVNIFLKSRKV